ncbi:MAG: serine/threonine protein kinase [Planctomycetales bacterium]|nr:serine/threonine protein kinase [Planctomycetales bacterium]MCA9166450.1 serine/threonine protein kinase [Planctomycetales bacterium]
MNAITLSHGHPTSQTLQAFLCGELDDSTEQQIEHHLTDCVECREQLTTLCDGPDRFSQQLRDIGRRLTLDIHIDGTRHDISPARDQVPSMLSERLARMLSDDSIPSTLVSQANHIRLVQELGRGGMGVIYAARDQLLGRELAVKVLQYSAGDSVQASQRFLNEARVCAKLQHPGIVAIHELGYLPDGRPFFTMKRVEGRTFAEVLQLRSPTATDRLQFLEIVLRASQAVAYAHSHQVIHRDLKPQNIMIGEFGDVQVVDWGLAKTLVHDNNSSDEISDEEDDDRSHDTQSATYGHFGVTLHGQVLGTPGYMSPEQSCGVVKCIDQRSDVYALGAILYEIFVGERPGQGSGRLSEVCDDDELAMFIEKCLASDRATRPEDASCIVVALQDYQAARELRRQQIELQQARRAIADHEQRRRQRLYWQAGGVVSLLTITLVSLIAYHQIQTRRSDAMLSAANHAGDELQRALLAEQDEFERAIMLADVYPSDQARRLLQLFRSGTPRSVRALTVDWFESQSQSHHNVVSVPRDLEFEFVRRLFDAHLWSVVGETELERAVCRGESLRNYRNAFNVFANWNGVGTRPAGEAVTPLLQLNRGTRLAAIYAIDDWLWLLRDGDEDSARQRQWLQHVVDQLDDNGDRRELRKALSEHDLATLNELAVESQKLSGDPAYHYFLVLGLRSAGANETVQRLLKNPPDRQSIWAAGLVADDARERPSHTPQTSTGSLPAAILEARQLSRRHEHEAARSSFSELFQDPQRLVEQLTDVQLNFVTQAWCDLGQVDQQAGGELIAYRDELGQRLVVAARSGIASDAGEAECWPAIFRVLVAINRCLDEPSLTVSLFRELDQCAPMWAEELFDIAEPALSSAGELQLLSKYLERDRRFKRMVDAPPPNADGPSQPFRMVVTLIALLNRSGNHRQAIELANDARVLWTEQTEHHAIDQALLGTGN